MKLVVTLQRGEVARLMRLARHERRQIQEQAAYLLATALRDERRTPESQDRETHPSRGAPA